MDEISVEEFVNRAVREVMGCLEDNRQAREKEKVVAEQLRAKNAAIIAEKQKQNDSKEKLIWRMVEQKLVIQSRAKEEQRSFSELWNPLETKFKEEVKTNGFCLETIQRRVNQLVSFEM